MGVCQKRQKRYPEALQDYQKLLELDEKNLIAITNIGLIHYEQGDLNLASSQFQKVSKLTPNLPKINWLSLSPKNWVESLALLGRLYMIYDIKNRGPGNPHFSQRKRMECLKALPSIDLNPILAQLPQRQCVVRI